MACSIAKHAFAILSTSSNKCNPRKIVCIFKILALVYQCGKIRSYHTIFCKQLIILSISDILCNLEG